MPCLSPVYLSMGTMVLPEVLSVADWPVYEHNSVTWCSVCHRSTLVWAQWCYLMSCLLQIYLCMSTIVLPDALSVAGYLSMGTMVLPEVLSVADLPVYEHNSVTWCPVCHRSTLVWAQWFCLKSCLLQIYLCMSTIVLPDALSVAGYLSMGTMVLPEVLSVADLPVYEHNSVTWCPVCHRSTLVWAQWFCLKSCLLQIYLCMSTIVLPDALSVTGLP